MSLIYPCIRGLFWFVFHTCYQMQVEGRENLPEGAAILAPNHTSFFDPPIVGAACKEHIHYLAKGSLFKVPILRFFLPRLHTHPLTGTGADLASFRLILQLLKEGKKVVIFPEGERAAADELLPFKPGIAILAWRAGCPIVPVYIDGAFDIWDRHHRFPKPWGKLFCCFGQPVYPELEEDRDQARDRMLVQVHEEMVQLRKKIRG